MKTRSEGVCLCKNVETRQEFNILENLLKLNIYFHSLESGTGEGVEKKFEQTMENRINGTWKTMENGKKGTTPWKMEENGIKP